MEGAGGGLPRREGLATAAGLVQLPQPEMSWEQLLDLPLEEGRELPADLVTAASRSDPGVAARSAAAGPEGSVFLAAQAQAASSPVLPSALPATQPAGSPLQQQLQALEQLEQMQQERAVRQALLQTLRGAVLQQERQEGEQQAMPPELLLLQTQLQDEEPPLADLLRAGLPDSSERSQQQQQAQQQQQPVAALALQEQQCAPAPPPQQQQQQCPQQQRQAQRELQPLGLPPLQQGSSHAAQQQHEQQLLRPPAGQQAVLASPAGEQAEQQPQQQVQEEPQGEQQQEQQQQQQQQQAEQQPQQHQPPQQQQVERGAGQPQAPRQGSAHENEQPPEGNSQEQPHARRRSARAAKRPAPAEADGAAVEEEAAAAAGPPGKRGRAAHRPRQRQQPHRAARAQHPVAEPSDNEAEGREDAAAGAEEAVAQLPPRPLVQEPPVPIEGAQCDLPPAPPRWEGHAPEPLTQQALTALAAQDAATHDQHLRLLRFDDRMAELASQSGLLVRFHVRTIRSYQAQAEVVVEAPEFLTVEYLKRRVARAKLQRGEMLPTTRFVLRKKVHGLQAVGGNGGTAAGPSGVGLEDLPSCTPAGDEVFLADLGYRAPGPYELCIASAPQTSDREQQESMLADLMVQAQAHQQRRQAAAAAAAAASRAAQPPELQDAALSYRALLQVAPSSGDGGGAGRSPSRRKRRSRASGGGGGSPAAAAAAAAAGPAGNHSMGASAAGGRLSLGGEGERSRRQAGRWNAEEVAALIEGVQTHGTRWAAVYDAYVLTGRIGQQRTQVDLKDKWRNLVRLVTEPGKQARSIDLTEEQRQAILAVVFAKQAAGATPGSAQRATPNGSAGSGHAAAADGHAEPADGEHANADGHARSGPPAGQRRQQQAGSSRGAGEEAGVLEGVPPTLERQRNKRQRRKAAQATEED